MAAVDVRDDEETKSDPVPIRMRRKNSIARNVRLKWWEGGEGRWGADGGRCKMGRSCCWWLTELGDVMAETGRKGEVSEKE